MTVFSDETAAGRTRNRSQVIESPGSTTAAS